MKGSKNPQKEESKDIRTLLAIAHPSLCLFKLDPFLNLYFQHGSSELHQTFHFSLFFLHRVIISMDGDYTQNSTFKSCLIMARKDSFVYILSK